MIANVSRPILVRVEAAGKIGADVLMNIASEKTQRMEPGLGDVLAFLLFREQLVRLAEKLRIDRLVVVHVDVEQGDQVAFRIDDVGSAH